MPPRCSLARNKENTYLKTRSHSCKMFNLITLKLKRKSSGDLIFSYKKEKKSGKGQVKLFKFPNKRLVSSSEEIVFCIKMRTL